MGTFSEAHQAQFCVCISTFQVKKSPFQLPVHSRPTTPLDEINVRILFLLRVARESALDGELSRHSWEANQSKARSGIYSASRHLL